LVIKFGEPLINGKCCKIKRDGGKEKVLRLGMTDREVRRQE
jgi:hypothetical protein